VIAGNVDTEGLEVIPYRQDRLVLVTSARHPLACMGEVAFEQTLAYDFVGLSEASAIHSFLNRAASKLNRRMKIRFR